MEPLHILHVEDNSDDAALVKHLLRTENVACTIRVVSSSLEFESALKESAVSLILSDFSMPGFSGLAALKITRKQRPDVPFIFVSGTIGEELAIEALRNGATDYVLKDRMARLPAAIGRAMEERDAKRRRHADEERLRNQAALLDQAQDAICLNDLDQSILYWNKSAERLYGWTAKEALGRNANELLFQGDLTAPLAALKNLIRQGEWKGELHQVTKNHAKLIVESRWTLTRDQNGDPKAILIINTDVTEKKQIEAQFLRTQRMETIGALAGGIAHDLNNSFTPVIMALSMAHQEATEDTKKLLEIAQASARHGVNMVKQILSFSRGVGGEQTRVNLETLIAEIVKLARDTFPKAIEIQNKISPDLSPVNGNSTQLHQVLLNLCINARDAMPNGGRLHIEASPITLDEMNMRSRPHAPGKYVLLTVSDTGHGIPADVLAKIFEPFFTTKEIGKGTGLGLSTVVGIVKTHGGFVEVTSEVGQGTLFRVFLPASPPTA
ncbi:MAG TPA: ATP-binding protein [Verrucomicrobiae bacterium]|jgi:PAS domain S-box-containing protein|nr:ATP-binding protein [Verrucomicrobiae bacterium]